MTSVIQHSISDMARSSKTGSAIFGIPPLSAFPKSRSKRWDDRVEEVPAEAPGRPERHFAAVAAATWIAANTCLDVFRRHDALRPRLDQGVEVHAICSSAARGGAGADPAGLLGSRRAGWSAAHEPLTIALALGVIFFVHLVRIAGSPSVWRAGISTRSCFPRSLGGRLAARFLVVGMGLARSAPSRRRFANRRSAILPQYIAHEICAIGRLRRGERTEISRSHRPAGLHQAGPPRSRSQLPSCSIYLSDERIVLRLSERIDSSSRLGRGIRDCAVARPARPIGASGGDRDAGRGDISQGAQSGSPPFVAPGSASTCPAVVGISAARDYISTPPSARRIRRPGRIANKRLKTVVADHKQQTAKHALKIAPASADGAYRAERARDAHRGLEPTRR